jgi:hypothetical protein
MDRYGRHPPTPPCVRFRTRRFTRGLRSPRHVPQTLDTRLLVSRRFRRLPARDARTSQSSCLCLLRSSNATSRAWLHRVRPFTTHHAWLLWPRLTSAHPSQRLSTPLASRQMDRSPRVRRVTFAPYTRRIYARPIRVASGFGSLCPLAHQTDASYAVRVPRAGALPAAAFPRHLAMTRLLFG